MIDINLIREHPEIIKNDLQKRQDKDKISWVNDVIKKDKEWRQLKQEADNLRAERNSLTNEITKAKKEKKDASKLIKKAQDIPGKIKETEEMMVVLKQEIDRYLMRLPNILHDSVPVGKDESGNVVVGSFGKKLSFPFELKSHIDLIERNNWADLERAAKVSGARWYFLKGELAILEMAISRYAVDFMVKKGYTLVVPPYMLGKTAYEGVTDLSTFEDALYKVEGEDLFLISTSEHPLTAMHMNETFEKDLPVKMVGYSTCFRKEAGAHGKDQKGIFRVHQFNKIEQIILCKPFDSWKFHEELLKNAEELFQSLGLHYRVVNICTGDIGIVAAKKYDIEVWHPHQQAYREVVSCSNCTDYQAIALNMRFIDKDKKGFIHTLNSTCVATSRALVAILENFQTKDGKVKIPDVLVPYMNGKKIIG